MLKRSIVPIMAVLAMFAYLAPTSPAAAKAGIGKHTVHKLVIQVNDNEPKRMNLVLNNAANIDKYYKDKGEEVKIEIVAYGPGLNMLIPTSPVKARIKSFGQNYDNISFKACGNTYKKFTKKLGKAPGLLPEAKMVPAGVIWIMDREEEGWSYIRP